MMVMEKMLTRRDIAGAGLLILLAPLAACSTVPTGSNSRSRVVTAAMLDDINALRSSHGLAPLRRDSLTEQAALQQAGLMAASKRMSHARFKSRMRSNGINGGAAENVATGQRDTGSVFADWRSSKGHLKNMLGPYGRVGVAVAENPRSGNRPYWAMVLAK